jgi:hypothetical protein
MAMKDLELLCVDVASGSGRRACTEKPLALKFWPVMGGQKFSVDTILAGRSL